MASKHSPVSEEERGLSPGRAVLVGTLILILIAGAYFGISEYIRRKGLLAVPNFRGTVIDKGGSGGASESGPYTNYWVMIKDEHNQINRIPVNRDTYVEAQKGMLFERTEKGIQLRPNPQPIAEPTK